MVGRTTWEESEKDRKGGKGGNKGLREESGREGREWREGSGVSKPASGRNQGGIRDIVCQNLKTLSYTYRGQTRCFRYLRFSRLNRYFHAPLLIGISESNSQLSCLACY